MKRVLTFGSQQDIAIGREKRPRAYSSDRNPPECELPRKRNDEYTVGWICAVTTEYVAAQAALDELHGRPESVLPANRSDYTLGRIGEHNVVIASLPVGEYGTASAAMIATDMLNNFNNIKARLMVGIGGGAPSDKHDIRLGDVVVSAPCNGHSGVVQYDFGKTVQGQPFQPTRHLDQPPMLLRTAMSGLAAQYECRGHGIEDAVANILEASPRLREKYSRPPESSDRLYSSTCVHPFESTVDCEISCGDNSLVVRPPRNPCQNLVIHYGLIASANQLMKDATVRDRLSSQEDILCFEMEAGGLMNHFPCLVIRGICDYSDSHKNKAWQGYAAMTAAAYAKDLIKRLSRTDSSSLQDTGNMNISGQPQTSEDRPRAATAEQKRRLLKSLRFDQIDARQMSIKKAHAETCQWLLDRPEYRDWLDPAKVEEHRGFLWIKGKPGTGKSTLMKFALANALKTMDRNVIYFFFNARGADLEKSTDGMYRSLLLQLLEKIPALHSTLEVPVSTAQPDEDYIWNTETLTDLLGQVIQNLRKSNVVCFIDALDECAEDEVRDMIRFFERVGASSAAGTFHVCFSSRHYPHITISKGLTLVLEGQEGHSQDMTSYIDSELRIEKEILATALRAEIQEKAAGIFMWVVLVVSILNKEYDRGNVHHLRKRLQEIPGDLHDLFRDILTRDGQNAHQLLCLQWVLFAKQPLEPQQLYFALRSDEAYEWNTKEIALADMARFILDSSKGLTEITRSETPTVQFIHESVKDYLIKETGLKEIWSGLGASFVGESHEQLKQCCLNYIDLGRGAYLVATSHKAKASSSQAAERLTKVNASFPFLKYAVKNVFHHANKAQAGGVDQEDFLENFALDDWIKMDNFLEPNMAWRHTRPVSIQYILAENNAGHLIASKRFAAPMFLAEEQGLYGPPLFAALATDSRESVRAMLDAYVDIDPPFRDVVEDYFRHGITQNDLGRDFLFRSRNALWNISKRGATLAAILYLKLRYDGLRPDEHSEEALTYAVQEGHKPMVEYFFSNGAKPDDGSTIFQQLLSTAIRNCHEPIVEFLFNNGAQFDPLDEEYRSLICTAAAAGVHSTFQKLLEIGAEVNIQDSQGRTPLSYAASWKEKSDLVALLLNKGAEVDVKDHQGRTPLSFAAEQPGNHASVVLLVNKGAEIDTKDHQDRTPLSYAAGQLASEATVALLLDKGAEFDGKDIEGKTPLIHASKWGRSDVARILLVNGAEVDAKDNEGRTALTYTILLGNGILTKLLLREGAAADGKDLWGRTPLSYAASKMSNTGIVQLLLDMGAEIDAKDMVGRTPLSYAVMANRGEQMVKFLLDRGAELDARDTKGRTPFSYTASRSCDAEIIRVLLNQGAEIDGKDNEGRTPLSYAASFSQNVEMIQLLLKEGAEVDAKDMNGRTPLSHSSENGFEKEVKALLENRAKTDTQDYHGKTPLSYASIGGYTAIVKLLLAKGVDINVKDDEGNTPLILATSSGCQDTVRLLIERGADVGAKNYSGRTALEFAEERELDAKIKKKLRVSSGS